MTEDAIIKELRKYREEHASAFNFDLLKIYEDLKSKEKINPNKKVTLQPKYYLRPTGTTKQS
ncbi:MAG: hypothetical protein V1720_09430 [bacterium]